MGDFFDMGGYAAYVWPSYAAFALIVGGLIWRASQRNARVRAELRALEAQSGGRRAERGDAELEAATQSEELTREVNHGRPADV